MPPGDALELPMKDEKAVNVCRADVGGSQARGHSGCKALHVPGRMQAAASRPMGSWAGTQGKLRTE